MLEIRPKGRNNHLVGSGIVDAGYQGEILVKVVNYSWKALQHQARRCHCPTGAAAGDLRTGGAGFAGRDPHQTLEAGWKRWNTFEMTLERGAKIRARRSYPF